MRLAKLWLNANTYLVSLVSLFVGLIVTFVAYQSIQVKETEAARLRFDRVMSDTARDILPPNATFFSERCDAKQPTRKHYRT